MILTERETERGLLVAACDSGLVGETFENGDVSITVNEEFYGGDEASPEDVADSLANASVANLVGTAVVDLAIAEGFVDEGNVLELDGARHAQFIRL